jgi:uncharacterized protein YdeI (YjbR/CyaY-like superfamily)
MNRESVDAYLRDGCGRCDKYRTPACKVHLWTPALRALRAMLLEAGLTEEMKWGQPCYSLEGANVVLIASLRDQCALSFFQGAALTDADGLLVSPGPNSRFARYLPFRSLAEVESRRAAIAGFLAEAMQRARTGQKVDAPPAAEPVPEELARVLAASPERARAFEALTPGRRRSHVLHVSGAKQSATRAKRAEACALKVLEGKGWNER